MPKLTEWERNERDWSNFHHWSSVLAFRLNSMWEYPCLCRPWIQNEWPHSIFNSVLPFFEVQAEPICQIIDMLDLYFIDKFHLNWQVCLFCILHHPTKQKLVKVYSFQIATKHIYRLKIDLIKVSCLIWCLM